MHASYLYMEVIIEETSQKDDFFNITKIKVKSNLPNIFFSFWEINPLLIGVYYRTPCAK